jgi:large subunit ribosomal protein L29
MNKATRNLRDQSSEQLNHALRETQEAVFKLRLQRSTERLEAPSELKKAKREIARILTILREREPATAQTTS